MVATEQELAPLDGTRPLPHVSLDCLGGQLSDENGLIDGACLCSQVFMVPLTLAPTFSKEGYVTQGGSFWVSDVEDKWLRVVLLRAEDSRDEAQQPDAADSETGAELNVGSEPSL